jgi:cation:H+ antiporter
MHILGHLFLALVATAAIWLLSGMLITATEQVARRYNRPGFAIAFIVLGMLTSISEMSVAVNATIGGVPQVSAGNLIGGSLVLFLLLIPLLAVVGNGVETTRALLPRSLALLLFVVLIPALFSLDGSFGPVEGVMMILLYITLIYVIQKRRGTEEIAGDALQRVEETLTSHRRANVTDILKIVFAGLVVFLSGKILVDEALFFSVYFMVPPSFVGLLLLSIGTNVPEIVIALRSILGRHKDIAFGDYLGSAAANTPLLGLLVLANGTFGIERSEFIPTFIVLLVGLVLFFIFARSKDILSRKEGWLLLGLYAIFVLSQFVTLTLS